jgi:hypothetical protein
MRVCVIFSRTPLNKSHHTERHVSADCNCGCGWTELVGCTRLSSDPPSSQGVSSGGGGWRQQGRYVKTKLQKTVCFIVVESLDVPPEHTHTYILSAALILPKIRVERVARIQSQAGVAWFQGRSWLAKMSRATNSVGQPIFILSHDPRTLRAAYL